MNLRHLVGYLETTAACVPDGIAVMDADGAAITYSELWRRASALAGFLAAHGIERGDRVGVLLPKSIAGVTALFGIMKAGAAYVPVDVHGPVDRAQRILDDCHVRALFVDGRVAGISDRLPALRAVVTVGAGNTPATVPMTPFDAALEHPATAAPPPDLDDLAYILYTSGSTGVPKGVMLTHRNASSFVEWCASVFEVSERDQFSSHAPFHFDLSVLDLYVCIRHGGTLHLISEALGRSPRDLAAFIAARRLTVWYSTPSILTLLLQFGDLAAHDYQPLRLVFFAGEVFPVKHLRGLQRHWPHPVYYNLYGPTETNVCTFARIPVTIPADRDVPYPIGPTCAHCDGLVLDEEGRPVEAGGEGLLYISGPSVFHGYWNRPAENATAFIERDGIRWYNTGDVVRWVDGEGYIYVGRKDRMVKRRGYRVELGEIERALYKHPRVSEAAVLAIPDEDAGVRIVACLAAGSGAPVSIIELKAFCGRNVPPYMVPDQFVIRAALPKTSTDKVDYQRLRAELAVPLRTSA